jgi:all-beta uncharacterized protein/beta-propeller repeat-containing protein
MKLRVFSTVAGIVCSAGLLSSGLLSAPPDAIKILATAPLRFEPDARAADRFVARGARFGFEFSKDRASFAAGGHSASLQFVGSDSRAHIEGEEILKSKTNLFLGKDPAKWRRGVVNYGRLRVGGLYPGVDLVYYGSAGELEYDLKVAPGADPARIRLRLTDGNAKLDRDGNLFADLIQKRPVAYQFDEDGTRVAVKSSYRRNHDGSYGFALAAYDRRRELVIDPVLTFSTYLNGSYTDIAFAVGHDQNGLIYVAGTTNSPDLPLAGTPTQATYAGETDVFVAQINPTVTPGQAVLFATYVGGTSTETFGGLAVGPQGDIYLTGTTESTDFPVTSGAYQASLTLASGTNAFVVWINSSQSLAYSTYLGGSLFDSGNAIALDAKGRVWITGGVQSMNFPTVAPLQSSLDGNFSQDIFVAGFDPTQSGAASLLYSTYLGGSSWDTGRGIAVASDGTLWIAAGTYSFDIPTVNAYQTNYRGGGDGYVAHIDPTQGANGLLYATFIGGSSLEEARNIVLDPAGPVIVSGYTVSPDFPVTGSALQPKYGGNTDAFITILNPANTSNPPSQLVYSTYFGGVNGDVTFDMKRDANGILYFSGMTMSPGLPSTAGALQSAYDGTMDAFVLKLNPARAGTAGVDYFTYLGSDGVQAGYGVDFDSLGNVYLVGSTTGPIFDALGGTGQPASPGKTDAFVAQFSVCGFSIAPLSAEFPQAGGTAQINITALGGDCSWTASSTLDYVTITPTSGTGNGTVIIAVAPNTTGADRQGTITIAGISYLVGQHGSESAADRTAVHR